MGVEIVTFGCRLNAFESEVICARGGARGTVRHHRHQQLRRHQRGRRAGAAIDPAAEARTARKRASWSPAARRRRRRKCSPTWPRSIASSAMTTRCAVKPGAMRARCSTRREFGVEASEKIAVADIMAVREMAPHLLEGFQNGLPRVFVQVQNGCDHRCTFCIIPYGPRQFALGADGRGGRTGPRAGRARPRRDRADRRRPHQLRRRPARRAETWAS